MCSIMGYCGPVVDLDKFKEGFQRTISRGPDDSRIVDTGNGLLGFHRLAIMGLTPSGMQPFQLDGSYVVCNGEIYGFEKIKEELSDRYSFASDSDCEILLPLYKEYGTDMFAMLDAEFACILYDGDTGEYIAARDPIGIRPLYYGYDEKGVILFASEAKNLVGLTDKIMPFPPGYYYKNGSFTCYCDITKSEHICRDDLETVCRNIYDLLIEGVKKRLVADAKVGFLLSGGLDSSLVCAIAAKESRKPIRTFAIGMREDAIDLKYAKQTAEYIGSEHTEIYMTPEEVIDTLEEVIHVLGTYDITTIRASVGMYLVCRAIHEQTDIRVLLTGEISDELFGYKYTDFAPGPEAFQEESVKRIRELHMYDVLRAVRRSGFCDLRYGSRSGTENESLRKREISSPSCISGGFVPSARNPVERKSSVFRRSRSFHGGLSERIRRIRLHRSGDGNIIRKVYLCTSVYERIFVVQGNL